MTLTQETNIGQLVADNYRTASVFKKNNIDFCCNGNRTISEVCQSQGLDSNYLITQLENVMNVGQNNTNDYNSWPLDLLADYIEKKHHRYVESKIPEIIPFLDKIIRVHGGHHPELLEVGKLFNESAAELSAHMKKEELILFPFIRKMVQASQRNETVQASFGTVENPIQMMMHEHDTEGERFRKIAALTNNYTPPADGCNTYRITLAMIQEFEDDLHLHIHLENNILFPKSIAFEKEQNKNS